jgi:hypothetical protein
MKKSFVIILATIFLASGIVIIPGIVKATTITVCDSGCNYTAIQAAIDKASSGDVISVGAGEYVENITVDKRLKIIGAGNGDDSSTNTIIKPSNIGEPVITIKPSASGTSDSERLVLSNIRVDGTGNNSDGIYIPGSGSYTTFSNVASVNNKSHGANVSSFGGVGYELKIIDCVFSNNGGAGFRTGDTTKISGLTITNTHADYNKVAGLYFNGPLTGLNIDGGSFDYNYDGVSSEYNGIGIYASYGDGGINRGFVATECKPNSIKNTSVSGNSRGIILNILGGSSYLFENITVSNNNATSSDSGQGITIGSRNTINEGITFSNITAENNSKSNLWFITYAPSIVNNLSIQNSTLTGSTFSASGYGLYLYAAVGSTLSDVSITESTVANNNVGVYLRAGTGTFNLSNNSMHYNNITGNAVGVYNPITGFEFNATHNWWGKAVEGEISALMSGDGDVDYNPWLCEKAPTSWVSVNGMCISRTAEITAPEEESVSGEVDFEAYLISSDTNEKVQWAVREGTCSSGTNTVFGNVDGHNDYYDWIYNPETFKYEFSATADTSNWNIGEYCFVFNPGGGIRLTRRFFIEESPIGSPTDKLQCMKGGWMEFNNPSFRNQGDCISYIQSNENAKGNRKDN